MKGNPEQNKHGENVQRKPLDTNDKTVEKVL